VSDEPKTAGRVVRARVRSVGRIAGPLLGLVAFVASGGGELDAAGRATAGLAVWMAVWWMTEAIPLHATALLPLAVLPFAGAATIREAAAPYAHELIFLFMGGFLLALAMQRWGLDRRIALGVLGRLGDHPARVVAGFMVLTAGFSMWVSNTATAVMMLPIAVSVIARVGGSEAGAAAGPAEGRAFARALLLGIAYAASIGGVATLIGTPPNLFLASYAARELGREISFAHWMAVGVPFAAVFLPITWWLLVRWLFPIRIRSLPGSAELHRGALRALGAVRAGELATLGVFLTAALAWMTRPWLVRIEWAGAHPLAGLSDAGIAIVAALVLFVIPTGDRDKPFVMDGDTALKLPWGLLLLFGGGLSLGGALGSTGVSAWLAGQLQGLAGAPPLLVLAVVVVLVISLTEITSNTATAAALIPLLAGLAPVFDMEPLLLAAPAAMAASCAFMLPVATPPNAVVFGSGQVEIADMVRAGLWLNLIGAALITGFGYTLVLRLLAG